jgi:ABC-2 type transport system ATP-binding protein
MFRYVTCSSNGKFHPVLRGAPVIQVDGLHKLYGDFPAVQGLTFTVGPGEVLGLVGPNGAGKTTTIRSIAGIIIPTSGRIEIAGHDLRADPVAAKGALAFIPDEPHLFDYLTVDEHLRFVARLYRLGDVSDRIPALLAELDLSDKREALPGELSRGMKQKLAIACGLLHDPKALLLDEPLTGLDPVGIRRMKTTIMQRAAGGAAVILSSHLLHLVEEICTRVLVMQRGRVVAFGSIAEILAGRPDLRSRNLEEVFLALIGSEGETAGT